MKEAGAFISTAMSATITGKTVNSESAQLDSFKDLILFPDFILRVNKIDFVLVID